MKINKMIAGLSAVCMISAAVPYIPVSAEAEPLEIAIEKKTVSLDELENMNYQVPVLVKFNNNPGISSLEFGITVDERCSYEMITEPNAAYNYTNEPLALRLFTTSVNSFTWTAWTAMETLTDDSASILLILVDIPYEAKDGDIYEIRFQSEGLPSDNGTVTAIARDWMENIDYDITGSDGYIAIGTAPEESETTEEPTTEEPAAEEPTTEEPATEEPTTEEPATEEPTTEEPATEEPTTEEPQPSTAGTVEISIEKKALTLDELRDMYYRVPIWVTLNNNPGITKLEFGITVDDRCSYKAITDPDEAYDYTYEPLDLWLTTATVNNLTWSSWASPNNYTRYPANVLLLLVELPETVSNGDKYDILYTNKGLGDNPNTAFAYNDLTGTSYDVTSSDGYIFIEPETTELPTEPPAQSLGDINNDGSIDIMDVILINKAIFGKADLTEEQIQAADINKSGAPDSTDALTIMKYIIKLIDTLA